MYTLLYRSLFCRKGFGVHSPFAFDLITNVIEERCAYYFYEEIDSAWRHLSQNRAPIVCGDRRTTVRKAFRQNGISPKEGRLLFRLANRRRPRYILTVGTSMGLIPFCLTGYASAAHCLALEAERDLAATAAQLAGLHTRRSIEVRFGEYEKQLAPALEKPGRIDCLYLGKEVDARMQERIFAQCAPLFGEQSVCIVGGIRASRPRKCGWQALCRHPSVSVSVDLYSLGILFFHPQLSRRTYKSLIC
ncbi:MAG: hypothetical protein LBP64_09615 [Tannerella sp.]|nr:hypothetical protein [Tannerella sp.]